MIRILVILFILCLASMSYGKKEEDSEHIPQATAQAPLAPTKIKFPPGHFLAPNTPNPDITPPILETPNTPIAEEPTKEPTPFKQEFSINQAGLNPDGAAKYYIVVYNTIGIAQMQLVLEFTTDPPTEVQATDVKAAPENKCVVTSDNTPNKSAINMECIPTLTTGMRIIEFGLPKSVKSKDIKVVSCSVNGIAADSCFLTK